MEIAGHVPLSLCDYPGVVAEVLFTPGCDFRCPWCHNGHLLNGSETLLPEAEILMKLSGRKGKIEGLVITGGEPTLQPDLVAFCRKIRTIGLKIKLDTNGTRPSVLEALYKERLLDFVAMDIKAPWCKYPVLTGTTAKTCDISALQRSVKLISQAKVPHQFRTTRVDPLLTEEDYEVIKRQIPVGSPHVWQKFRPEYSLDARLRVG